jgi:hypothetical protein
MLISDIIRGYDEITLYVTLYSGVYCCKRRMNVSQALQHVALLLNLNEAAKTRVWVQHVAVRRRHYLRSCYNA